MQEKEKYKKENQTKENQKKDNKRQTKNKRKKFDKNNNFPPKKYKLNLFEKKKFPKERKK